jgi:hypothetical protein
VNRLVLKYPYPITAAILAVFAWVVYRRLADGLAAIIPLAVAAGIVWLLGTFVFIYFWPQITVGGFKRAIVKRGFGGGPVPVNTLYAVPHRSSQSASTGSLMAVGTDDLVYIGGWLDLEAGPLVLHVPEMAGRYYSVQFTDPSSGANVAYVGKRTTGTDAGAFLVCERTRPGNEPIGMTRIEVPHRSALVIGRVFAADDDDRDVAYALAKQIELTPARHPAWRGTAAAPLDLAAARGRLRRTRLLSDLDVFRQKVVVDVGWAGRQARPLVPRSQHRLRSGGRHVGAGACPRMEPRRFRGTAGDRRRPGRAASPTPRCVAATARGRTWP